MKIEKNNVMIFTLIGGMEVIAKVSELHDNYVEVKDAFAVAVEQGQDESGEFRTSVGLRPMSPFAFEESKHGGIDLNLYFATILISLPVPQQLSDQYSQATGSIIAPQNPGIIKPN
jgi:hypothetical protein